MYALLARHTSFREESKAEREGKRVQGKRNPGAAYSQAGVRAGSSEWLGF